MTIDKNICSCFATSALMFVITFSFDLFTLITSSLWNDFTHAEREKTSAVRHVNAKYFTSGPPYNQTLLPYTRICSMLSEENTQCSNVCSGGSSVTNKLNNLYDNLDYFS